jgi:chemotaxis protein CheD
MGVNKKRMQVRLAGGANMATGPEGFDIGKRNYLAIRKILWSHGMFIDAEDVGGNAARNLYLDLADGTATVRSNGLEKMLR